MEPAGRGASPQRPRRGIGTFAREGLCVGRQRVYPEGFALGLHAGLLHCTHSLLPQCFPHLHRVKMHTFLERKLCFLKKPLTLSVHISMLGRNMMLFFPLDLSSDPCHPVGHQEDLSASAKGWAAAHGAPQQDPPTAAVVPLLRGGAALHRCCGCGGPALASRHHHGRPRESRTPAGGAEPHGRLCGAGLVPVLSLEELD